MPKLCTLVPTEPRSISASFSQDGGVNVNEVSWHEDQS